MPWWSTDVNSSILSAVVRFVALEVQCCRKLMCLMQRLWDATKQLLCKVLFKLNVKETNNIQWFYTSAHLATHLMEASNCNLVPLKFMKWHRVESTRQQQKRATRTIQQPSLRILSQYGRHKPSRHPVLILRHQTLETNKFPLVCPTFLTRLSSGEEKNWIVSSIRWAIKYKCVRKRKTRVCWWQIILKCCFKFLARKNELNIISNKLLCFRYVQLQLSLKNSLCA